MTDIQGRKEAGESGIIVGGVGGLYSVRLDKHPDEITFCRAKGSFRHKDVTPLVGDRVLVNTSASATAELSAQEKHSKKDAQVEIGGVICEILDRKNALIRPPMANLDYIFVTMASASPEPILHTVDKLCCIAEFNGITPVIVVGKCELDREKAQSIKQIYESAGYRVFTLSCYTGEGTEEIRRFVLDVLPSHIAAFAGASGVGKSSLMNLLFPDLGLEVSDISRKIERGRHTTRRVDLFPARGGYIADTPGFSMLDFERFDFFGKDDLAATFREFRDLLGECRYTKCTHTKEEGCAIIEAVRDGRIAESRHASYVELFEILKKKKAWDKK